MLFFSLETGKVQHPALFMHVQFHALAMFFAQDIWSLFHFFTVLLFEIATKKQITWSVGRMYLLPPPVSHQHVVFFSREKYIQVLFPPSTHGTRLCDVFRTARSMRRYSSYFGSLKMSGRFAGQERTQEENTFIVAWGKLFVWIPYWTSLTHAIYEQFFFLEKPRRQKRHVHFYGRFSFSAAHYNHCHRISFYY